MTPRRRTAVRWSLHAIAVLLIVASGFMMSAASIGSPVYVVGEVLLMAGVMWFAQPMVARLHQFVQRSRKP